MKKQKLIALLLALVMVLGVTGIAALAEGEGVTAVSLRIEGLEACLFVSESCIVPEGVKTVADLLAALKDTKEFPAVTLDEGQYGAYIADIDGLAEASHGEMSGWNFRVDDEVPAVGIGGFEVKNGQDIVIFFGDPFGAEMQYPIVDTSRLMSDGIIRFTSKDSIYDEDWNETIETRPIVGATVEFDKASMITDENGEIAVPEYNKLAGLHYLQIDRYDEESGVPTVLRYAPDYVLFVPFSDMAEGAWYNAAIEYCVRTELLNGMGDNTFAPDKFMTMAELVKVLGRIVGEDTTSEDGEPWFAGAMNWAIESGIIHDSEYNPNAEVTREIFIYMFYNTAALVGDDMEMSEDITDSTDYDSISEEFIDAIEWAVAAGLITGIDSDSLTIAPGDYVSRAVVCQMMARYYA